MKTRMFISVLIVAFILASCTSASEKDPTETVVPASPTVLAPTETPVPTETIAPTPTLTLTPSPTAPNPFIGYWIQTKLSEHFLGMAVCGNFQNVEFLQDGTFIVINDYSGIYKPFDFGQGDISPSQEEYGEYAILNESEIEIKWSADNVTVWEYMFSGDSLTMSSPNSDEFGGGFIPCYFIKSNK